jgi:hypothetical protein
MLRTAILSLTLISCLTASDVLTKPAGITVHTWVREDLFAAYMVKDMTALERGERKLDELLKSDPPAIEALAWKSFAEAVRMREAKAAGDEAAAATHARAAAGFRKRALEGGDSAGGATLTAGGALMVEAGLTAEPARSAMFRQAREMLRQVQTAQRAVWDQLPQHFRGEMYTQMAYASQQLGENDERDRIISEMLAKGSGSPYETKAKRLQTAGKMTQADLMCISCHEPGRLEPTLARLAKTRAGN